MDARLDKWDYGFCATLVILSNIVGIYYSFKARRLTDVSTFLINSSDVGFFPVIFSAVASQLSAIGILGMPSEIYQHGIGFAGIALGVISLTPLGVYLYLPVLHGLKINSIYQYLELRFDRIIRRGAAYTDILCRLFHASVSVYAPAVALNQVTGLPIWTSVLLIGFVCTGYTSLGGIKAIVWTDVCQLFIIVATMMIILVKSSIDLGGIGVVWQQNIVGGRTQVTQTGYYTPWTAFAGAIGVMTTLITNQMIAQRYLVKGDLKSTQMRFSGCCIGFALCIAFNCLAGFIMYAKYHDCDPMQNGQVTRRDQIMALFSMETLSFLVGFRGVFVAAMLCATLSTLSSLINTMVVVTVEDIIRPLELNISEKCVMRLCKILAILYGILSTGLVAVAQNIPGVIPAIFSFYGVLMGPLLGVFTAGMLLPWVNTWGAIAGYVAAVGFTSWPTIGIMLTKPKIPSLPYSIAGCNTTLEINLNQNSSYAISDNETEPFLLYTLAPLWYTSWSLAIVLVISLICSCLCGSSNPDRVQPHLLFPIVRKAIMNLPKKWRKLLGFSTNKSQHLKTWGLDEIQVQEEMRALQLKQ